MAFPYLATSEISGFSPDRRRAYGQLLIALLAVSLAAGLGFVAVQQLVAGRQSVQQGAIALEEDRRARVEAKEAQVQAV